MTLLILTFRVSVLLIVETTGIINSCSGAGTKSLHLEMDSSNPSNMI